MQIPYRKNPGITFSVYTEYDSDEHGDYTYFVGEEVDSFENIPSDMQQLVIPAAKYQKFTTTPGKMPEVVIDAWQQIWKMTAKDFGFRFVRRRRRQHYLFSRGTNIGQGRAA